MDIIAVSFWRSASKIFLDRHAHLWEFTPRTQISSISCTISENLQKSLHWLVSASYEKFWVPYWKLNYRPQRSWAKVMFLQASVILSTGGCTWSGPGGVYLADTPHDQVHHPPDQVHPPGLGTSPRDQVHPPGPGTPPWTRYTPQDQVHPPGPGTHPSGPGTPPWDQVHPPD